MARKPFPWHIPVFLAPAVLVYSAFSAVPLLDTLRLGFFTTTETGERAYAGFASYRALLFDPVWSDAFWNAMWNNTKFFLIHMLVQNPIALLLAALLSARGLRGARAYRTLMLMPTMLSVVVVGFIWQLILSPLWGVAESLLGAVGLGGWFGAWLGQESSALVTLSLISVWQYVGVPLMLIYAALLGVPEDILEAAVAEGASPMRVFWQIKLPLILPTLGVVSILTFVNNFNAFDLIYTVKGAMAGPNYSTDLLGTLFYRTFFGYQAQLGSPTMGAAIATLMFLVILTSVMAYFYFVQRRLQRHAL